MKQTKAIAVIYPVSFEDKIAFTRLREMLTSLCESDLGKRNAEEMHFLTDFDAIDDALSTTEEFRKILLLEDQYPSHQIAPITAELHLLRTEGSFPDVETVQALRLSLETLRDIHSFFKKKDSNEYVRLRALASQTEDFPDILREINRIMDPLGQISDHASPELAQIRAKIEEKQRNITRTMRRLLKQAQDEGWVEDGVSLSVRDGRSVIPITASFKRKIGGIVHDESATGKTSYVEPAEAVEANNQIRELHFEEVREIQKILIQLADKLRPHLSEILHAFDYMGTIDFLKAKALLAIKINAVKPVYHASSAFTWLRATHPIMYLNLKKEGREVVPLDIQLREDCRILLISGPNAGGKSVCLKTVGLLQYMFQCGLLVPLSENSEMGIFDHIFIDIGDEQSIDNDLSTYSSHLMNMKYFVKHANERTLILIDEFGTGTEPILGGAIAESVLSKLQKQGVFGVITTHYANLKQYASCTEGIQNGAMLYDAQHFRPLFRLETGKPGSSFAFEMARKIGLPEDILTEAADKAGKQHIDFEKYLHGIDRDKRYWERKRDQIRQQEKKLDEVLQRYQSHLEGAEKERKSIIQAAKDEAATLLAETNRTIENTIRTIKESQAEKEKTKTARGQLAEFRQTVDTQQQAEIENEIQKKIAQIQAREQRKLNRKKQGENERKPNNPPQPVEENRPCQVGDAVRIKDQSMPGEIVQIDQKRAKVAVGQILTTIPIDRLERISRNEYKKIVGVQRSAATVSTYDISQKRLAFQNHKDVRGMRTEEALEIIGQLIDEASMLGISEIKILHGKGNGILRKMIREYLSNRNEVLSFDDEDLQMGGAGITVVDLR